MSAPVIKGWCPGAYRPMMSGDGFVVRIRPWLSHLNRDQVLGLCDLAKRFGNGTIDLTSRANLQIRGVAEASHPTLIAALQRLHLLDADPKMEARRNIAIAPDWQEGDLTHRLGQTLNKTLQDLPELPAKMGFAIDTGDRGQLAECSADFRFEQAEDGSLILRADGCPTGKRVAVDAAMSELGNLMTWFSDSGGPTAGRMRRHLQQVTLPQEWQGVSPREQAPKPAPGARPTGRVLGAPFGQLVAPALAKLMTESHATALRPMHGRLLLLVDAGDASAPDFVTEPNDPLLSVHACPGAPFCPQAEASTRELARVLAPELPQDTSLHVSGCAKGCAFPRAANLTLVGSNGRFNLVSGGAPWDEPDQSNLTPVMIYQQIERM